MNAFSALMRDKGLCVFHLVDVADELDKFEELDRVRGVGERFIG